MIITLTKPATCADCGAELAVGTRARWYRNGRTYGLTCHARTVAPEDGRTAYQRGDRSPGARASHYDRGGVYSADGTYMGRLGGRCEDAPCCGCCP